jgi:hypothetical protein
MNMTEKKIDRLDAENLESRVAPVVFDQPGGSDGHRQADHKKTPQQPVISVPTVPENEPVPGGPYEEPIL